MHFDPLNTLEGRHLLLAYVAVFLIQGGYFAWIALGWRKTKTFAAKKINEAG